MVSYLTVWAIERSSRSTLMHLAVHGISLIHLHHALIGVHPVKLVFVSLQGLSGALPVL
jgi:hypothetical protein